MEVGGFSSKAFEGFDACLEPIRIATVPVPGLDLQMVHPMLERKVDVLSFRFCVKTRCDFEGFIRTARLTT